MILVNIFNINLRNQRNLRESFPPTQIAQITQIFCPPLISQILPITLVH